MKLYLLTDRQVLIDLLFVFLVSIAVLPSSYAQDVVFDSNTVVPQVNPVDEIVVDNAQALKESELSPAHRRIETERLSRANRFLLTPHKRNFLSPVSYHDNPNQTPYVGESESLADLSNIEAEIQFSIKILLRENIFGDNGHLYMGYTNHAFWQLYSDHDSAPFRETNHQPELILSFDSRLQFWGLSNVVNEIIFNHQSNGQGGMLSRSWNRVMVRSIFSRGNLAFAMTPWVRISEKEKAFPTDPDGDDNPDIIDYMGHFELGGAYKHKDYIYDVTLRNNFAKGNATTELGWSFPVSRNLRGYLRYFDGYGHSLIDYNSHQQVFSLGVIFTDLF